MRKSTNQPANQRAPSVCQIKPTIHQIAADDKSRGGALGNEGSKPDGGALVTEQQQRERFTGLPEPEEGVCPRLSLAL